MRRIINNKRSLLLIGLLLSASALFAAIMASSSFKVVTATLNTGGGKGSSASFKNTAALGGIVAGNAQSASYKSKGGYISQYNETAQVLPAADLNNVFVYPNPYKPGSGGEYDAVYLTFKNLTADATIRVFNIAGELVATFEKEDETADYHEWAAVNDAGEKLASGVYIYFITNTGNEEAKGKFSIIK